MQTLRKIILCLHAISSLVEPNVQVLCISILFDEVAHEKKRLEFDQRTYKIWPSVLFLLPITLLPTRIL
jgi:hypothetical protein